MKKKDDVMTLTEWLEFVTSEYATHEITTHVNVRRSEISEVCKLYDDNMLHKDWCTVVMKNGNRYDVHMPYEKVMELV